VSGLAAFWPLLAMVELAALLAAVLVCFALGIAGLALQLRRRRAQPRVHRAAGRDDPTPGLAELDDDADPFPF
jgi:hypothetical protein